MAENVMEQGSYEVLKERLNKGLTSLENALQALNDAREETFGAVKPHLIGTERINTDNNCIARDMIAIGNSILFGFNVHMGLKAQVEISDVFAMYDYEGHVFHRKDLSIIQDAQFIDEYSKLYKYYKDTTFHKFVKRGPYLYMVFRIGKTHTDIKAFKWQFTADGLQYLDNRSDHEVAFPNQHDFKWKKTTRDDHRNGKHPHISIEDRLFVETIGGDLTIKVEDNTDSGKGIFREPVENKDQTLDDAEIFYAIYGSLVLLRIRPYQEDDFRYIVFNEKLREARKIPAIKDSGIFLPDDQGIIFSNGYYLQSGDFKTFEADSASLKYDKQIASPNGEDYMYVYFQPETGRYQLLSFNIISRQVATPINCHGYALFENGEIAYFNADDVPKKHHVVQLWQSPFTGANFQIETDESTYLHKIGNRDIVRAMAECREILTVASKGEGYDGLYNDLVQQSTDVMDSYHWLGHDEAFNIKSSLTQIRETANSAIEEFEKVQRVRQETANRSDEAFSAARAHINKTSREGRHTLEGFVENLGIFRRLMGEVETLKSLRYSDEEAIEEIQGELRQSSETYAAACVRFLLRKESLDPYKKKIEVLPAKIADTEKVVDLDQLGEEVNGIGKELEMLIEVVGNLKIDDATQTTEIIERISGLFAQVNQQRAALKKRRKSLAGGEARAEFTVQIKLVEQSLTNYLDLSDTPEKSDEYMTKLLVQVEELESKFGEFEDFLEKLAESRESILDAFESRKNLIIETRNRKKESIFQSALRILQSMENRMNRMKDPAEIEAYFSADIMAEKLRRQINELLEIGDPVKADDLSSRMKSLKEEAIRQLKDRTELFADGDDVIRFGNFKFNVNRQPLELSIIPRNGSMFYHLGGTNFFEQINDDFMQSHEHLWNQVLASENDKVYRSEFLAYELFMTLLTDGKERPDNLLEYVQEEMSDRYNEGYAKGIHDVDAATILEALLDFHESAGLLRYTSSIRARAVIEWNFSVETELREELEKRMKGLGLIFGVFRNPRIYEETLTDVSELLGGKDSREMAAYLVEEVSHNTTYIISSEAKSQADQFEKMLKERKARTAFNDSLKKAGHNEHARYEMICTWLKAFLPEDRLEFLEETGVALLMPDRVQVSETPMFRTMEGMKGSHSTISENGDMELWYNAFFGKLAEYVANGKNAFETFQQKKQELTQGFSNSLRLDTFKPRVMSSFVRNKLINDVYLPLIGANLAKQIGEAGNNKRTDLMGLLLLVSPPGYGKTTLMEYLANRLGLIFMKINGPSIGHDVVSLDPSEARSATARQELEKLNLSFEMGDNVMIYLDDIQHLSPEFLQKFISLCDAQRKIEGVYKGQTKTYDFRGKKVCVVMAGNPYTESGEKFKIPDMLANRADIYNLGDIIGDSASAFELSYLENCITSNSTLKVLSGKSQEDIYTLISSARHGQRLPEKDLEGNFSQDEIAECINVFGKLLKIRDVIMAVNQEYVQSAAQADEFRTEPPFKLQGSYRDMNKIAEKVFPVMNEEEVEQLIRTHYQNEAQSLTRDAEANLIKFDELNNWLSDEDAQRWEFIKTEFMKLQKRKGYGNNNAAGMIVESIDSLNESLKRLSSDGGD